MEGEGGCWENPNFGSNKLNMLSQQGTHLKTTERIKREHSASTERRTWLL